MPPSASGQASASSPEQPSSASAPEAEPSARPSAKARGAQQGPVVVLASAYTEEGGGIEGYLRVHRGIDLDAALSAQERVELLGLRALVDSYLVGPFPPHSPLPLPALASAAAFRSRARLTRREQSLQECSCSRQ